jgi:hypothetical protein
MRRIKKILKEPLLHFLLLGAAIFLLYGLVGQGETERQKIVVTQGQIERLIVGFTRTWQRPPTQQDLHGLIQDYIKEEVYYREAMAMELDRDDTIVRRRLRQKLEFLTDDLAAQAEPTGEQLSTYLKEHPEAFRTDALITFSQVYLSSEKHGDNLARDTTSLLEQLKKAGEKADTSEMGDPFLLNHRFENVTISEVNRQFGQEFSLKLAELSAGEWQGPIASGYGIHLVFVSERTEGKVPSLSDIREDVRREWANAQRLNVKEEFFQSLLKKYDVLIEAEQVAVSDKKLAEGKK